MTSSFFYSIFIPDGRYMAENKPKDIRQNEILEAALSCFSRKGYNATSVADITKEAGITKGGLYWHFKSKWDIFKAILKRFKAEHLAIWKRFEGQDLTRQTLIDGGKAFLKAYIENPWIGKMKSEIEVEAFRNEEIRTEYMDFWKSSQENIHRLLSRYFNSRVLTEEDKGHTAVLLEVIMAGLSRRYFLSDASIDIMVVWEYFIQVYIDGIEKG